MTSTTPTIHADFLSQFQAHVLGGSKLPGGKLALLSMLAVYDEEDANFVSAARAFALTRLTTEEEIAAAEAATKVSTLVNLLIPTPA
jgi:hypothetical protein